MDRGERRRRTEVKYKSRIKERKKIPWQKKIIDDEDSTWELHLKNTPTPCSCSMCGNPRKKFNLKTKQELLSENSYKNQLEDLDGNN